MKKGRIYCVHYGGNAFPTRQFVNSVTPFLNENLELVIINNSKEIDLTNLASNHISIINTEKNLGYFGAIKFGMDKYPVDDINYSIVCNNDILIKSPDFFKTVSEKLDTWDIIAPSTKTIDNIEQNPHRQNPPSLLRKYFYKIFYVGYFFASILTKVITLKKDSTKNILQNQNEREIFSPHGAFIIIKSTYFSKGGYIDDGYFLYGEEDSLAAIAKKLNLKTGMVPSLEIIHQESISTGKGISRKKYEYKKEAYLYIRNKYPVFFN